MKKRTTKVLTWVGAFILVLALVAAVFLGTGRRSLRKAYEALEADGRPMTPEQVIPAQIPDSDNAALVYQAVVLQLQAEEAGEGGLLPEAGALGDLITKGKADDEDLKRFKELMSRETVLQAMAQLERGTLKKGCRYDLDYSKGAEILMPHISHLRNLSRIVCGQALVAAAEGKEKESWDTVIVALRLADALREEPLLISQLVRIAQFAMTADTIQALTKESLPGKEQYAEIVSLVGEFEEMEPFVRSLDGERILCGEWAFRVFGPDMLYAVADTGSPPQFQVLVFGFMFSVVKDQDHAAYLDAMRLQTAFATQPFSAESEAKYNAIDKDIPVYCILTRLLLPALGAARSRYFCTVSLARVTRAGLTALCQAGTSEGYPESIEGIKADGLIDPFTNRPLIYRKMESGFIVYSVGPDLNDDGGGALEKWKKGDIAWRYPAEVK